MSTPEILRGSEHTAEIQSAAAERAEALRNREHSAEQSSESKETQLETAREAAEQVFAKEAGKERTGKEPVSPGALHKATKADKQATYRQTMSHIQNSMGAPSRAFSRVIHTPFVERSSDVLGSSLARPNAILAGSFSALLLVSVMYVVARTFGYQLSGFESIGAFVIGWIAGILFDYVKVMTTGK